MARFGHLFTKQHISRRPFAVWFAVFALLIQALMPMSSALAFDAAGGGEIQVICTSHGVQTIVIDQDGNHITPTNKAPCPFCVTHVALGIFSPAPTHVLVNVVFAQRDYSQFTTYTPSSIWRGAPQPSRAPPLSV